MTTNIPVQEPGHNEPGVTDEASNLELKEVEGLSQGQIVRRRFFRHKGAVIAMIVLAAIILLSTTSVGVTIGPWRTPGWWPFTWDALTPVENRTRPSLAHPFGQDEVGRDIFALVMRGTQQSLSVMFIAGIIATVIGVVIGALSGYYRKAIDSVLMRFTDVIITIPIIVIGAVLGVAFGSLGASVLGVVIGLFSWTSLARLVRAEFLSLREREFVDAARVAGARDRRIIFRHILPNTVGVIIVNSTLLMAAAILLETALSFLGFGVQSPDTSLGKIISDNQAAFATRPWLFWWPGLFIIAIALCINFIGDGLRDAFDPRQKRMPSARALAKGKGANAVTGDVAAANAPIASDLSERDGGQGTR
ncbi:ABC transporter permease [Desertivibrio insolitus]|uniref:ABC transporter permease n=1 Tax=Herbiconiux sp. SYSU D00978 TaxID=2812562 RepID=UPI001A976B5C|nr:ABC transporter permease [Herbiconiux sp. SYSU D00978]